VPKINNFPTPIVPDDSEVFGLPGQSLYYVKNNITREYKPIWAKDREDAILKLGWYGQVKWVTWIKTKELPLPKQAVSKVTKVSNPSDKLTLSKELGLIDKSLNKDDIIGKIEQILRQRRKGKPINKQRLRDLSKHYYYKFVKKTL
jgi:hypothetical protein